ncbi:hypothetical protein L3Q82_004161 [Scortum barcoo]|uniref:Uncharacterized protein n=1 Tax=Scortum barcoo TaxID=214431 RepID=A0ACB8X7I2_9TELE|nr:hypothetical protein L3Q82_004161 [Scortum barcoo]
MVSGDGQRNGEERQSSQREEAEEEEELFKDVDPKTLAAVLLEALNHSQIERRREGVERNGMEEEELSMKAEMGEVKKKDAYRDVRTMEGADRDRDGRQELELLVATQGNEQEREEEEERKKAQEEEKMTEKVTSHTTSQTVQVQTEQQHTNPDGREENGQSQQGPNSIEQVSNEEEEQLSPEELKNLETMMKEFPRLNTANKREEDSEQNQRESRGYSSYNDIIPINKGSNLAMSKKKLKWQEETQKALNFPSFRGGNFMDDFDDSNYAGSNAAQSRLTAEQEVMEDDEPQEEEEEEEERR